MQFVAFPERKDAAISSNSYNNKEVYVESSGSLGLYYGGKCHQTHPNQTLSFDQKLDWCSNIAKSDSSDMPWITYSLKNKAVKATGFALRNGCCWYDCCCSDDDTFVPDFCCCRLYSFSFQGSNDNKTWVTIFKAEKVQQFYPCMYKTFTFEKTVPFKFLRLHMDEPLPGCPLCMQINEIQIFGETISSFDSFEEADENEESVSIIGKIQRNTDD